MRRFFFVFLSIVLFFFAFPLSAFAVSPSLAAPAAAAFLTACGISLNSSGDAVQALEDAWQEYSGSSISVYDDDVRVLASGDLSIGGVFWGAMRGFIDWLKVDKGLVAGAPPVPIVIGRNGFLTTDGLLMAEGQPFLLATSADDAPVGRYTFPGGSSIVAEVNSFGAYTIYLYKPSSSSPLASAGASLSGGSAWLVYSSYPSITFFSSGGSNSTVLARGSSSVTSPFYAGLGTAVESGGLDVSAATAIDVPQPVVSDDELEIGVGAAAGATAAEIAAAIQQGIAAGTLAPTTTVVANTQPIQPPDLPPEYEDYKVPGFKDVFPFSIPWDVYRMLRGFNGIAQAPAYTIPLNVPMIGNYNVRIDLSDWDSVALICRRLEFIVFALALAYATRKLVWR